MRPQKNNNADKYDPANIAVKDINFKLMNKTYFHPLCNYAKRFVNQEAEDIVQDIFTILWEKRETIYIVGKLSSYLHRSVHNVCLNYLKRKVLLRKFCEQLLSIYDIGDLTTHDNNDPLTMLITHEMECEIEKGIEELPEQCRRVFEMWLDDLTYQEIAEKLDIIVGSVRKQINIARGKLRKSYGNIR